MSSEKPFAGPAWDERILSLVDAGVDGTIIEENLRRTPTERLRRMQEMARFIELARDRRPASRAKRMLGKAAVAMWWDVPQNVRAEWEDWHTHEHMPERLSIPGFLRGTRWIARSGKPSYFVLYEAARIATLTRGPYLERLNRPTPWSRKMMPHHRNMIRSLCRVRASAGGALAEALATLRFSLASTSARSAASWLSRVVVPQWSQLKGLAGACLLESHPMPQGQTTEQAIRGGDARADWVLLAFGYDAKTLAAAATELRALLMKRGAVCDGVGPLYRPAFSLTSRDA